MTPRRARARRSPVAIVALALAFCGLNEETVLCEEAAAHLSGCCPGFFPHQLRCAGPSFPAGCATVSVETEQARCITRRSCDALQATGTCERALSAWTRGSFEPGTFPVCR